MCGGFRKLRLHPSVIQMAQTLLSQQDPAGIRSCIKYMQSVLGAEQRGEPLEFDFQEMVDALFYQPGFHLRIHTIVSLLYAVKDERMLRAGLNYLISEARQSLRARSKVLSLLQNEEIQRSLGAGHRIYLQRAEACHPAVSRPRNSVPCPAW
jgi:hypothetical protein